jgi:hypothetical protein
MTVWQGYLVISFADKIYLADSRDTFIGKNGCKEYEWYFLNGIGTYKDDSRIYRYASVKRDGYEFSEQLSDCVCDGVVRSDVISLGDEIFYTLIDGKKYEVFPTDEYTGGTLKAVTAIVSVKNLLFFGTDGGDLCIFNNDKRGVPPPWEEALPDFNPDEYKRLFGLSIHPSFYSFAGHSPVYALSTPYDNCDIPHLTKNTVKGSLVIKLRAGGCGLLFLEVGTDFSSYKEICPISTSAMTFQDLDFTSLSLSVSEADSVAVKEKEKGWVEKQISLYSKENNSPIGIYSISFRYTVKGKVKNKK